MRCTHILSSKDGGRSEHSQKKRARNAHRLSTKDGTSVRTTKQSEQMRDTHGLSNGRRRCASRTHVLSSTEEVKSQHRQKAKRQVLTLWGGNKEGTIRMTKESLLAKGTHILPNANRGSVRTDKTEGGGQGGSQTIKPRGRERSGQRKNASD